MNAVPPGNPTAAWSEAACLVGRWLDRRERIDELMERLPRNLTGIERARCQHLVFGVVRHEGRLNAALGRLVPRPPRLILRAILYVAGYELLEAGLHPDGPAVGGTVDSGLVAKVVHHAVERAKTLASPAEARLVNAVVRRLVDALAAQIAPPRLASAGALAEYFSHPEWLVARWLAQFGADATRALLEWNQQPAPVYARWRTAEPAPAWLAPTRWPGFFEVPSGRWGEVEPLLASGQLYLQDPSARLAIELLAPQAGETVLDLCAAPGGKSLQIADALVVAAEATRLRSPDPVEREGARPGEQLSPKLETGLPVAAVCDRRNDSVGQVGDLADNDDGGHRPPLQNTVRSQHDSTESGCLSQAGGQTEGNSLLTSAATGAKATTETQQTSLVTSAATGAERTKDEPATGEAAKGGRVVAVDLPGDRLRRLRENLARVRGVEAVLVEADAVGPLAAAFAARRLPAEYAAVLIDVPCSNTGVMRHRVDVKWRLQEGDFARHAHQQLALLEAAAQRVAPGGRLVYSTCSIDPEENEHVVAAFLRKHGEPFTLEAQALGHPWETGCDGTGAFRLRRKA
jgi:16S rRNA C967 or C1407 C5-methylase (RsmB/RsmF family)